MLPPNFKRELSTTAGFAALAALGLTSAAILIALAFEHLGGYIPCALCLEQRTAYYWAIPLLAVALLFNARTAAPFLIRAAIAIACLLMAYNAGLGVYHAGFEWGFWAGPADCAVVAGGNAVSGGDLLATIDSVKPPSCDQAALRVLGLSFAGWNAVVSLVAAVLAGRAAFGR
jgi:disulfide bond formation protein DsbB